jgi:transcriptional regulator with XRE-family HTH domain
MNKLMTIEEMEQQLGASIRRLRLQKNLDRGTVCQMAGISLNALRHLETGSGTTVKTLLLVTRALNRLEWLDAIAPKVSINPLHMVRNKPQRQRARRKIKDND